MTPQQFEKRLEKQRQKILVYEEQWGRTMSEKALKWVHQSFEAEAYRNNIQIPWKKLKKLLQIFLHRGAQSLLCNSL